MNHKFDRSNFTEIKNFCSLNMMVKNLKNKPNNGDYIYNMKLHIQYLFIYTYL